MFELSPQFSCSVGRADEWDGPGGAEVPVEQHPGDGAGRAVRGPNLPQHGGVRGPLLQTR